MSAPAETYRLPSARGWTCAGTRYPSARAALAEYSAAQRRAYGIRAWALPGGGYDAFPAGHPVPAGARAVRS
jgi:hypothetical protein